MNCNTGDIKEFDNSDDIAAPYVPVREKDLTKLKHMAKFRRKGWMRNQPCICGSGKKFKKCCWSFFNTVTGEEKQKGLT